MLNLITQGVEHIYLACGPTDFRKQIEGLAALVSLRYHQQFLLPIFILVIADLLAVTPLSDRQAALCSLLKDQQPFIIYTKENR